MRKRVDRLKKPQSESPKSQCYVQKGVYGQIKKRLHKGALLKNDLNGQQTINVVKWAQ